MSGELRVTAGDLRQLSTQHRQVASDIASAGQATDGTSVKVATSHGLVCALTAAAVVAAERSRSSAAQGMQSVSTDLAGKLDTAASKYDGTDQDGESALDSQMRPR